LLNRDPTVDYYKWVNNTVGSRLNSTLVSLKDIGKLIFIVKLRPIYDTGHLQENNVESRFIVKLRMVKSRSDCIIKLEMFFQFITPLKKISSIIDKTYTFRLERFLFH